MADQDEFDPYYKWLAIPTTQQPPNHYRLLGLRLFEEDRDVIESAADRQMAHIRSHSTGQRAAHAQKLLNELAKAKLVLLNLNQKSNYDRQLKAELSERRSMQPNGSGETPLRRPPEPATQPTVRGRVVESGVAAQAPGIPSFTPFVNATSNSSAVSSGDDISVFPTVEANSSPIQRPLPRNAETEAFADEDVVDIVEDWRLITEDGQEFGPIDRAVLNSWVAEGRVTASCRVRREGDDRWLAAAEVFPVLTGRNATVIPNDRAPRFRSETHSRHAGSVDGITIPILVSAIANLVVGLFWFITLVGIVIAIPMFALAFAEFNLYSNATRLRRQRLAAKAQTIAVFEIFAGLFNLVSLACGIIVLINASSANHERI